MNGCIIGKDKYYTKLDTVNLCMSWFNNYISVTKDDIIIEPSAGDGSFVDELEKLKCTKLYYDIEPHHQSIKQQDYLHLDTDTFQLNNGGTKIHVVGNPPFGKKSSLAIMFIKRSCTFCDSISFVLPKSFKKESLKKSFSRRFHLVFEEELPLNSFIFNGDECSVPCVFQIWKRMDLPRDVPPKLKPYNQLYQFVKSAESPDLSFRRVGVNAGRISRDCSVSEQSHYFLKFDMNLTDELLNVLKSISFDDCKKNTVGSYSISKQELIEKYNKVLMLF